MPTDDETVNQLAFHEQWLYALNITGERDAAKYLCPKTLWSIRQKVTGQELDTVLFEQVTGKLARVFQADPSKQRLNSVHTYEKNPICAVWAALKAVGVNLYRATAVRRARRRAAVTGPGPKSPLAQLIFLVKEHMQAFGNAVTDFFIPDVSCYPFDLKMAA